MPSDRVRTAVLTALTVVAASPAAFGFSTSAYQVPSTTSTTTTTSVVGVSAADSSSSSSSLLSQPWLRTIVHGTDHCGSDAMMVMHPASWVALACGTATTTIGAFSNDKDTSGFGSSALSSPWAKSAPGYAPFDDGMLLSAPWICDNDRLAAVSQQEEQQQQNQVGLTIIGIAVSRGGTAASSKYMCTAVGTHTSMTTKHVQLYHEQQVDLMFVLYITAVHDMHNNVTAVLQYLRNTDPAVIIKTIRPCILLCNTPENTTDRLVDMLRRGLGGTLANL